MSARRGGVLDGAVVALVALGGCGGHRPAALASARAQTASASREPWRFRTLTTGLALPEARSTRYQLTLDGRSATLEVTEAISHDHGGPGGGGDLGDWRVIATRTLRGQVATDGAELTLTLAGDDQQTRWRCHVEVVVVAPASALLVPTNTAEECGDEGEWSEPATDAEALVCADDGPEPALVRTLAFAHGPGIEGVWVNDDCLQGGGLRWQAAGDAATAR